MVMDTQFNMMWVILSVVVAIFASYVALNLAQNITQTTGKARAGWLTCGAMAMGTGIWSMHFIGMLAFEMPGMAMAYDVPLMVLSVLVAIGASALALYIVSRPSVAVGAIVSGGVAMAAAIAGMHYIGMASMRMAATIEWNIFLVVLSIVIALVASFSALYIISRLRDEVDQFEKLLYASTVMGFAIAGMHYTGMLAATYHHTISSDIESSNLLVSTSLPISVTIGTLFILGIALASSVGQRLWSKREKTADEVLGKSEERFRRLVEAVKDYAIFMLDTEGRITTWNAGAKRINGYSDDEVIGKHVSIFYTQSDIDNHTAEKELQIAKESGHFEGEGQRVRKDGTKYLASLVITPLFDSDGSIYGFSKVTRDITLVREAEARMKHINEELEERVVARTRALEQRENQLRAITDAAPIIIAQLNRSERVLFANEAFRNWFQLSNQDVLGKTFAEILGPDRYPANRPFIQKVLGGEIATYERESRSGDTTATLGITLVPEFDDKKHVEGFIVVASDITKHKEIQAELKKAKEAAEVANATKSAFLANMSHEIRTPLGAVLGFSELLVNDEMTSSERVDSFEIIKRNGRLLSNIINDILDLSKVEAGKLDVEKVEVSFDDIMKEMSSVLNLEAAEKGIELSVTSVGTIPNRIKTDPLRLRQILFNIVGNAIKFTSRGSVNVKVKLIPDANGTTKLAFVVADTGEGIEPEQAGRLFRPLTQADVSTTRKFGGTGLGLVLAKKLANVLGGDVVLTSSTPGKGSIFTVTIDPGVADQVLFQSSETARTQTLHIARPEPVVNLRKLKVLLVDDSIDNQVLIKKILMLAGANVETANNGKEAVEKALHNDYSVILMDLQMPEMDGYEATKLLRGQGFNKPIIALTAHAMASDKQRSLQSGFNSHLTKPIDNVELVRTLSEYSS
jgi:PAS domain S-box-containing protein